MADIQELGKKSKGAPVGNTRSAAASAIWDSIHYVLANYEKGDIKRGQALKAIAMKAVDDALDGDKAAREWICERYEGKVAQKTELTGADGGPMQVQDVPLIVRGVAPKRD